MTLWLAHVSFDMVVQCDSEEQAADIARAWAEDGCAYSLDSGMANVQCAELKNIEDVPQDWGSAVPCGNASRDDTGRRLTVAEILAQAAAKGAKP